MQILRFYATSHAEVDVAVVRRLGRPGPVVALFLAGEVAAFLSASDAESVAERLLDAVEDADGLEGSDLRLRLDSGDAGIGVGTAAS